jgi:diguanylate cyclase (GGDEF)-like protein
LLELQNVILGMIAKGESLQATAERLCVRVEKQLPGVLCSVMTVDRAGLIHPLAAPGLPDHLNAMFDGLLIGPGVGNCGSAAYLRTPVLVEDIEHDPRWAPCAHLALPLGLRAGWSNPIIDDDGSTIGVLGLYFREVRGPTEQERAVVETCVQLIALALQRHQRLADSERRATVDALTGLPNRAAFDTALSRVRCDEPGSWALLTVDLDNLKVVNDTFGHQAGDALLQAVSKRVAEVMSPEATFRFGGDEFAVIIQSKARVRDLEGTASAIFAALDAPVECDGHVIAPGATIGSAVFTLGDTDADAVKQHADFALYHAKENGRGGFVRYRPGLGTKITRLRDVIRDVAAALDESRIDAHYQPIVRLDTREIVGIEALCRMTSPSGELLTASDFMDATADARVASRLTERMFSIVAADMRRWLDADLACRHVSVNVSTPDFYTGRLIEKLGRTFGEYGIPLDHLILEVNENVYIGQRDRVVARELKAMRAAGLRIALDDFGIGYASLTHLLSVPVDTIKIDRSFVAHLWPEDPSLAIVDAIIGIARKLGIRVVAEGIETELQARQLWAMGCRFGQGFGFSKAVDRDAITELLRRHAEGGAGLPLPVKQPDRPRAAAAPRLPDKAPTRATAFVRSM